jgi:peptidoglycan/LPS O-acetylase OafA/YrhL
MQTGPEYQRAETRVDVAEPYSGPVVDRRVSTARSTRSSPAAIVGGIAGAILLVLGAIAVARGGLSGPITEPAVEVVGFTQTPLLGLIEAGVGLILLLCALWGTRASMIFLGTLIAIAGIVVVATPDSFADTLAAESSYGWFLIIVGAVVALVALFVPDRSSRVVTYRS